jgi:ABC-type spermidine/putrescine transport system permease subunit I
MLIDLFVNEQLDWSLAAAASFWLLIIITLLMLAASRFVKLGETMAAR